MSTQIEGMDFSATHSLGPRALVLFIIRHIKWPLMGVVIAAYAWYWTKGLPDEYLLYGNNAGKGFFILAVSIFLFKIFRAYFDYRSHDYRFDKEFFHVSINYFFSEEIGVVYHHIQTVTLKNTVLGRLIGVCDIKIIMTSYDATQAAEVVLPALDRKKGRMVQSELLRRAKYQPLASAGADIEE